MIEKVFLPKLGETMEEATIERWIKKEGEEVKRGEVLLEITTDKATLEVESYATGVLRKILLPEGSKAPVNTVIALVGPASEPIPEELLKAEVSKVPAAEQKVVEGSKPAELAQAARPSGKVSISPRARRLAEERGIDWARISGTGPGGRIVEKDVEEYARTLESAKVQPLSAMRKIIAERMSKSKREIPHYYLFMDFDMEGPCALRERWQREKDTKLSYDASFVKASGLAIRDFPTLNSYWKDGSIVSHDGINVGVAVALSEGLIVPVVHDADKKSLEEINRELNLLVEKARTKRLTPAEYEGGSFTVTNLGMYEVASLIAVINPGESAILALGQIAETPVVEAGQIKIRRRVSATLSLDHRVIDGAVGAPFLRAIKEYVENPERLI